MNKRALSTLLVGATLSCAVAMAQDVVVIVNNGVKASSASVDDIRSVFIGDKSTLPDGSHVTPVTLKGGAVHEVFLKNYVRRGEAAYLAAWRSLVFTGQGLMPKSFDSEAALLDYVAATPGTVGYASRVKGGRQSQDADHQMRVRDHRANRVHASHRNVAALVSHDRRQRDLRHAARRALNLI